MAILGNTMQSCTASLMTKLLTEQREKRERAKQLPDEQVRNDISYTDIYSTLCVVLCGTSQWVSQKNDCLRTTNKKCLGPTY